MIHEYFERKASEWNILGFLEECDLEPYLKKIDEYLKCLEIIANTEEDQKREKAQELLDNYKQGTHPDKKKAKEWDIERSRKQVYLHQPTIKHSHKQFHFHQPTINMTFNGTINGVNGTINGGAFNINPKKNDQEEKDA
ncbi:hypothetical protein Glove_499g49 [Diversispora epigaea]|uniref:Uncharacterized protein n=1 Tax=Diversispora epigaea TaxID=1348612 RepID=A0A397GIT8_9GLOM|nr:hypothetical protein Glove_499g49 [Diversispora epigaea]